MDQVGGCQAKIQGFTNNTKKAQKTFKLMIGNIRHRKDHLYQNQEEEREILNRLDEAKQKFDEDLVEMEQREGLHCGAPTKLTELFPFRRVRHIYRYKNWEGGSKEEEN